MVVIRMYWVKKILEWIEFFEEVFCIVIYFNDKVFMRL